MSYYANHSKPPLSNFGDPFPNNLDKMPPRGPSQDFRMMNANRSHYDNRFTAPPQPPQRAFDDPRTGLDPRSMEGHRNMLNMDQRARMMSSQNMLSTQSQHNPFAPLPPAGPSNISLGLSKPSNPNSLPHHALFPPALSRPASVTESVKIPEDLAIFASEPKFQQILLRVKEQTNANFISILRGSDSNAESVTIDAASKEAAELARNLIETHLKLQLKIKAAENRLQKVQTDLFSTQGEIAAGQFVEFSISPELLGLTIGKKGARIKQVETETGVTSVNVADNGKITIYGPDAASVQKARDQLEIIEDHCPVSERQAEWLNDRLNAATLTELRNDSGLMVARLNKNNEQVDFVGTVSSVHMAKFLWATQLEYVDKQIEIELNEREARDKLTAVRKQYGLMQPRDSRIENRGKFRNGSRDSRDINNDMGHREGDRKRELLVPQPQNQLKQSSQISRDKDTKKFDDNKAMEDALDALVTAPEADTGSRDKKRASKSKEPEKEKEPLNRRSGKEKDTVAQEKDSSKDLPVRNPVETKSELKIDQKESKSAAKADSIGPSGVFKKRDKEIKEAPKEKVSKDKTRDDDREPMLVKINTPFLAEQARKQSEPSGKKTELKAHAGSNERPDSLAAPKISGPPRDPPQNVTSVSVGAPTGSTNSRNVDKKESKSSERPSTKTSKVKESEPKQSSASVPLEKSQVDLVAKEVPESKDGKIQRSKGKKEKQPKEEKSEIVGGKDSKQPNESKSKNPESEASIAATVVVVTETAKLDAPKADKGNSAKSKKISKPKDKVADAKPSGENTIALASNGNAVTAVELKP